MTPDETTTDDASTDEWEFGDPCPDCGCRTVNYTEKITRKLGAGPDGDDVRDLGVLHAAGVEATCDECDRFLGTEVASETVN